MKANPSLIGKIEGVGLTGLNRDFRAISILLCLVRQIRAKKASQEFFPD
jgi:hypothetical protein